MLAYVFSHRAEPGADLILYEAFLRRFHAALEKEPPAGFISSCTYRIGDGYSDWYLVEGSAALDTLNRAAISGARAQPHDAAAQLAKEGSGKLMSMMSGTPAVAPGFEIRFSKPAGTGYSDLELMLRPWTEGDGVSLWKRMMVLGPPPEFCLVAPTQLELPAELQSETLSRHPL